MTEEKKNYRVVFTTTSAGTKTIPSKELFRTELELTVVSDTGLWQPKVSFHDLQSGFQSTFNLPYGSYADWRARLEKLNIRNSLDLIVRGLTHLSSLLGDKSSSK